MASVTVPFWRTGPTQSRVSSSRLISTTGSFGDVDEHVLAFDPDLVLRKDRCLGVDASPSAGVVLPSVRAAREHESLESTIAEPHALVTAAILVSADDALDVDEKQGAAADVDSGFFAPPNV